MEEEIERLHQRLLDTQDQLAQEVERRREVEWELYMSQIRCADALDELYSLRSRPLIRVLAKIHGLFGRRTSTPR